MSVNYSLMPAKNLTGWHRHDKSSNFFDRFDKIRILTVSTVLYSLFRFILHGFK